MQQTTLTLGFLLVFCQLGFALDPYDAFLGLPKGLDLQPRVLNSDDIPNLRPNNPQELITPKGDFNQDGYPDIAVSGVYDLPASYKYFLLIASLQKGSLRRHFYQEFEHPVFLHAAGTTGPGDPKTQAFSLTSCWDCEKGFDVFWNAKLKTFEFSAWENRKPIPVAVPTPEPDVPEALVEQALKIVGLLPDIQAYVTDVQKRNSKLGTRVGWDSIPDKRVRVTIFEKSEAGEKIYDEVVVGGESKKILKRQRTVSGAK